MAPADHAFTSVAVRAELSRIVGSRLRNRRFPGYVFEKALTARSDQVEARMIATEGFGRDLQRDAIVCIEPCRLRRSVEHWSHCDSAIHGLEKAGLPIAPPALERPALDDSAY